VTREARLGWALVLPALTVIAVIAVFPIGWTLWASLHVHDLRMPWLGRPFVGMANYAEAFSSPRFRAAIGHTLVFTAVTVALELAAGLALALIVDSISRARDLVRTAVLLPWAVPTVVVGLVWRFLFENPDGLVNVVLRRGGVAPPTWFADATAAWVPLMLADAWKTTPFVAILLLAGLMGIDPALHEAARIDGAGWMRRLTGITLPLLRPALLVAFIFRALDAFRVFDVMYVMTGGGPGTATEPIALLTFGVFFRNLRFGYGAALSIIVFGVSFVFALASVRLLGRNQLIGQLR
jgi:ABC-type sugar transport system permease subunit